MTKKLFLSQAEKVKTEFWLLNQDKVARLFFYLLILFLPTQLGKHFWPKFSFIFGLRLDYLSPTLYLTDVFILLIFIFSANKLIKEFKKINKKYILFYLVFLICLLLGLTKSQNPLAGAYGFLKIIEFSYLIFYISVSFRDFNKKTIFTIVCISIVFESLLSLAQYINNSSLNGVFYLLGERTYNGQTPGIANATINGQLFLRPYATFSHPNVLAGFLVIASLYLLFINISFNKTKIALLTIFIASMSLLLSLSRTAIVLWLFYLFLSFTFLIFEKFKNGKSKTGFVLTLLVLIVFVFLVTVFKDSELLQRVLSLSLADESVLQRADLLNQSLNMFIKNPFFGVGINNFYNNLSILSSSHTILIQPVHNIFFLILSETGLLGFVFFILLLFKSAVNILKKGRMEKTYLMCMFFAILFLGLFDHYFLTIQQGQLLLALFFGTVFSYKKT